MILGLWLLLALFWLVWALLPKLKDWHRTFSELSGLPGPRNYFGGMVANAWEAKNLKTSIRVISKWCQTYGPVVKLSGFPFPVVALNSPEYVQKLLGSKDSDHFHKTLMYEPLRPLVGKGLFTSSGDNWRSHRQPMSYINSFRSLQTYTTTFNKESVRICRDLEQLFSPEEEEPQAKCINHLLAKSTLVTITEALFGRDLTDEPTHLQEIIDSLDIYKDMRDRRFSEPWLLLPTLFRLHSISTKFDRVATKLHHTWSKFLKEFLEEMETNPKMIAEKMTLFQHMIRPDFSHDELIQEALTMTTAGYETTGVTLQFLLFFLALHPEHQDICRAEVDDLLNDPVKCPNEFITQQHTSHLKYLERCIHETLRFFPAVYSISRKLSAPLQLDANIVIPARTNVGIFLRELHMNPEYFPNPKEFNPNRFSPEECRRRHPYAYLPFAAGPRKCIGFKFAGFQMLVTCARILRNFVVTTPQAFEDVNVVAGVKITTESPINFNFIKRYKNFA